MSSVSITDKILDALGGLTASVERSTVAASGASVALVAANADRRGLAIFNGGDTDLYLAYGTAAATTGSYSVKVPPGALYEAPAGWAGLAVQGIWAESPTGSAQITEVL